MGCLQDKKGDYIHGQRSPGSHCTVPAVCAGVRHACQPVVDHLHLSFKEAEVKYRKQCA